MNDCRDLMKLRITEARSVITIKNGGNKKRKWLQYRITHLALSRRVIVFTARMSKIHSFIVDSFTINNRKNSFIFNFMIKDELQSEMTVKILNQHEYCRYFSNRP